MKKKSIGLLAVLILLLGLVIPAAVQAETFNGSDDWKGTFTTDATLVSNFHNNVLDDTLSEMEPGDVARFQIELVSAHASDADWYMKNNVLYSLEDRSKNAATAGGGYTYRLVFTGATVEGNASGNPSADGNGGKGSHSTAKIVIPVIAGGGILAFIVAMLRKTAR